MWVNDIANRCRQPTRGYGAVLPERPEGLAHTSLRGAPTRSPAIARAHREMQKLVEDLEGRLADPEVAKRREAALEAASRSRELAVGVKLRRMQIGGMDKAILMRDRAERFRRV